MVKIDTHTCKNDQIENHPPKKHHRKKENMKDLT